MNLNMYQYTYFKRMFIINLLTIFTAISYLRTAFLQRRPPPHDFLSPIVSFLLTLDSTSLLISFSIWLDALGDFYINSDLEDGILLFGFGHIAKLLVVYAYCQMSKGYLILIFLLFLGISILTFHEIKSIITVILGYAFVMLTSMLLMVYFMKRTSWYIVLFLISDAMVLATLIFPGYSRWHQTRLILAPVCYWVSQYIFINEFV